MRRTLLTFATLLSVLVLPRSALSAERFVLRASPDAIQQVCVDHGLRIVREVGRRHLLLVEAEPGVDTAGLRLALQRDSRVYDFEVARRERRISDLSVRPATPPPALDSIDRTATQFFGTSAWSGYANQPAVARIGADHTRQDGEVGAGVIIAVIDSRVDPGHPLLAPAVVGGFDFAGSVDDGSPGVLEQSPVTIKEGLDDGGTLEQSPVTIKEGSAVVILEQSPVTIKEGSGSVILEQSPVTIKEGTVPEDSAHGTMVAGLIRLVAPEARIMPLRVFADDGTTSTDDIIRAIYYAVDHGARVINMSFSTESREMKRAIQYATNRGVICVAAAGNRAKEEIVFPAALQRVLGVASTTLDDVRAPFSNYGERLVSVAAPGEYLITAYPNDRYALVSGTSFSAALVSGAAAILAGAKPDMDYRDADDAFRYSLFLGRDLGFGRIDIPSALSAAQAQVWTQPRRWLAPPEEDQP
jgi:hypothetical protein